MGKLVLASVIGTCTMYMILLVIDGTTFFTPPAEPLLMVFYKFLVVGFAEEMAWRIFLQTYLEHHLGNQRAIVITALLFMAAHVPSKILGGITMAIFDLLLVFYSGLVLGFIWNRMRSLPVIAAGHVLIDSSNAFFYELYTALRGSK